MTHPIIRTALTGVVIIVAAAQVAFSQDARNGQTTVYQQYEMHKMDPWGPFTLNLLLGLGIGSFAQGDTTGGLLVAGGEILGIVLIVAGASASSEGRNDSGPPMLVGGLGLLTAARIFASVIPFPYANAFNETLRRDLGISVSSISWSEQGVDVSLAVDY